MVDSINSKVSTAKAIPIFMAFLCMGFADVVSPITGIVKEEFVLSNFEAFLIPMMGFIMFGILSIPMGIFQDRNGKKPVLLMGLIIALSGLIIPLFGMSSFGLLLFTLFLLGAGAAILQVAGNPIMRDISAPGKYSRNLSFGQFIKAIGTLSGSLIPLAAARWWGLDWKILFPIYSAIVLLTIVIVSFLKVKENKYEGEKAATFRSCFSLLRNKYVLMMVLTIFVYVGAEVSVGSGIPIYLKDVFGLDIASLAVAGTGFFFLAILIGRFLGTLILNWMPAKQFLLLTVIISIISILGLFIQNQTIAIICIFTGGLGFANIFPLVFSITVDSMPKRANELSGLMITAIIGGALIPLLMGIVADNSSILFGFAVPVICMLFILVVSFISLAKK